MNSLNLNIYNILILLGILHGIIFSLILFFNTKLKSKTNNYLALTILSLCFSNLQYWFLDVGLSPSYYVNNNLIFIPFEFLIAPFFLLFVKSFLDNKINKNQILILLTPFNITLLYLVFNKIVKIDSKVFKLLNLGLEYISLVFSLIIIILIIKSVLEYERKTSKKTFIGVPKIISWLKRILILGFVLCVVWLVSLIIFEPFSKGYYQYYPLWIGNSIFLYWIAYASIFQNNIFQERGEIRNKIIRNQEILITQDKISKTDKSLKSINPTKFEEINNFILTSKIYLEPKLSLKMISESTNLSIGYISQLINSNLDKNFNDYINTLRVENSKKLLFDEDYSKYTIIAIGLESGFNSKASFYSAFKKHTGQTPSNYKKLVQNH